MSVADPVIACLSGAISPEVAIARLLLAGVSPDQIARAIGDARGGSHRWHLLDAAFRRHAEHLPALSRLTEQIAHEPDTDPTAMFDALAVLAPDCGAAFYALNDPELLDLATAEIINFLNARGRLRSAQTVLDFGCGPGRLTAALARTGCDVLGVDISSKMIAIAKARSADLGNARFAHISMGEPAPLHEGPFGLIIAVDVFPYLMMANIRSAADVFGKLVSLTTPDGTLVLFNLSYRDEPRLDLADAHAWALSHDLHLGVETPFRLWDATAFTFSRPRASLCGKKRRTDDGGTGDGCPS